MSEQLLLTCSRCSGTVIYKHMGVLDIQFLHDCPQNKELTALRAERDRIAEELARVTVQRDTDDTDTDIELATSRLAEIGATFEIASLRSKNARLTEECERLKRENQDLSATFEAGPEALTELKQKAGEYDASKAWFEQRPLNPEVLPLDKRGAHLYTSTACHHGQHDRCRKTCKFCERACMCSCHAVLGEERS